MVPNAACPFCGNHDWDGPLCKTCKIDLRAAFEEERAARNVLDGMWDSAEKELTECGLALRNAEAALRDAEAKLANQS